jgi:hypothetical protein
MERGVKEREGAKGELKSTLCFSLPSAGSGQALYERRETGNKRLERWKTLGRAFKWGEEETKIPHNLPFSKGEAILAPPFSPAHMSFNQWGV